LQAATRLVRAISACWKSFGVPLYNPNIAWSRDAWMIVVSYMNLLSRSHWD
jgi:hypothetical protein